MYTPGTDTNSRVFGYNTETKKERPVRSKKFPNLPLPKNPLPKRASSSTTHHKFKPFSSPAPINSNPTSSQSESQHVSLVPTPVKHQYPEEIEEYGEYPSSSDSESISSDSSDSISDDD